jgi:hypothetical protein
VVTSVYGAELLLSKFSGGQLNSPELVELLNAAHGTPRVSPDVLGAT